MKTLILAMASVVAMIGCTTTATPVPTLSPSPTAAPTPTVAPTPSPTVSAHDIGGTLTFNGFDGQAGYEDINPQAQVTLTDQAGTVLAVTQLGTETPLTATSVPTFTFDFGPVPDGPTFYSVEVSHRGKVTDSAAQLAADGWVFSLTLGTP